ncbi:MAG: DUF2723 domain-containing protein [candidate division Zixibacteria bacterium]|nr:DUF2723 domain-containing protein [candidate division Zixibacteria bacterium]
MNPFRLLYIVCGIAGFLASLVVYVKTIAPTVPFWDGGEFIAASYILGVPHPPGSPLYILLGRLFSVLPFGNIAWQVNFSSCLFSALTIVTVYAVAVKAMTLGRDTAKYAWGEALTIHCGALAGALMLAFSDTFWFNAVEAEVYALSMLNIAACTLLLLVWIERHEQAGSERYLFLIAYLIFLGIAAHMFSLLVAPAVFLCVIWTDRSVGGNAKIIALFGIMGLIMTSVVASIYPFLIGMPLTILGLMIFKGRIPWTYFLAPIVLAVLVMFFGVEGAGGYNAKPGLAIGGFEVTIGTLMGTLFLTCLALALISATSEDATRYRWQFWAIILALGLAGYSVNFYVPIRAAQQPIINENDPSNWKNFEGFLERKQYGQESMLASMFERKGSLSSQFGDGEHIGFWRFFSRQFSHPEFPFWVFPVLLLGLGLIAHWDRDRRSALFLTAMFIICSIGLVLYMNFSDGTRGIQREVRERDYFFTPAFVYAAILMGIGLSALLSQLKDWVQQMKLPGEKLAMGGALLSLTLPIIPLTYHYPTHTREGNFIPYDYGYNILQSCDKDAILFTNGDNDTFTLWFLQEVEGIRKDVRVVNLSLLNTDWYIKQLKNLEPKVPISFSDREIEQLGVRLWEDKQMTVGGLSIVVPKAGQLPDGRGYLRVQDQMVIHIVDTNKWKRPVYFAVTVSDDNKAGLREFLSMEGMVFRVTQNQGRNQMDLDRTHKNLWTVYKYRGIADTTMYKDAQTTNLLRNYAAAFQQLAVLRWERGEVEQAIREMEKYLTLKITDGPFERTILAQFYADAKQYDKSAQIAEDLAKNFGTFDGYIGLTDAYRKDGLESKAFETIEKGLAAHPRYPKGYEHLARMYFLKGDTTKVLETLERWRAIAPNDSNLLRTLAELRR